MGDNLETIPLTEVAVFVGLVSRHYSVIHILRIQFR